MVYISDDGEIVCDHLSPKAMLDKMRYVCKGKIEPMNHAPQSSRTHMCSNTVPHYTDNNVPTISQASYQ